MRIHHAGSSSPNLDAVSPIIVAAIMLATRIAVSPTYESASTPGAKIALDPFRSPDANDIFHLFSAGGSTKVVINKTGATTRIEMADPEPESTMRLAVLWRSSKQTIKFGHGRHNPYLCASEKASAVGS